MKTLIPFLIALVAAPVLAQKTDTPPGPEQPPVVTAPPAPPATPPGQVYEYDQKLVAQPQGGRAPLVTADQAQSIIERFKASYAQLGSPRLVIYVNRELVDENSGLKVIARTEKVDSTTTTSPDSTATTTGENANNAKTTATEKAARENRYRRTERKEASLADRQTTRDIERLFGRPFRMAGARMADQRLATQLMADKPLTSLPTEGEQARKDREALSKIADIAIELLVGSKKVEAVSGSGNVTYELPDIQVTALRLKDAEIIGQAASSDILRGDPVQMARHHDVREVTEAVALALMEDMIPPGGTAAK